MSRNDPLFRRQFLEYIDNAKHLTYLKNMCDSYSSARPQSFYRLKMEIDLLDLTDHSAELGNWFLAEPLECQALFKEVIFEKLSSLKWFPQLKECAQLILTVAITSLPMHEEYEIVDRKKLSHCVTPGYYRFDGTVVSLSTTSNYTGKFPCPYCGEIFEECVQLRFLSDELAQKVSLGASYSLIALAVSSSEIKCGIKTWTFWLEASNLRNFEETLQVYPAVAEDFLSMFYTKLLAKLNVTMDQLSDKNLSPSHYISPALLTCGLADFIAPSGVFYKLKMVILLTLVASRSRTKPNLSLVVRGRETNIINRLLSYGCKLSTRSTRVTDASQLRVASTTYPEASSNVSRMTDANPLLLAHSGVCYLGDLAKFPPAATMTIANVLEHQRVDTEANRFGKVSTMTDSMSRQLSGQVWAYASCPSDRNSVTGAVEGWTDSKFPRRLLDAFSVVHCTEGSAVSVNGWADEQLADLLLNKAMGIDLTSDENSHITIDEWIKFLNLINAREVHLGSDAEQVIRSYFLASRRARNRSDAKETELSPAALTTMLSMAKSHAKLSHKPEATEEDASVAIYLYEEYLTARYGISCLNVQPSQHVQYSSNICDALTQIHEEQKSFHNNLARFLNKFGNDGVSQKHRQPEE